MQRIKTGYSKNILAHGKCRIIQELEEAYLITEMIEMTRPEGTKYCVYGWIALANKDEVSDIKEEEI